MTANNKSCGNLIVIFMLLGVSCLNARSELDNERQYPWSPKQSCILGGYSYTGLHPDLTKVLEEQHLLHRVTNALNTSRKGSNYHNVDETIDGEKVTSAVDISILCLNDEEIKSLLSMLADHGIVGWLRRDEKDGWKGAEHIHAIWASGRLKSQLSAQVQAWLNGYNGLKSNLKYSFWNPSEEQKTKIRAIIPKKQVQ